jgi:hypothetical protein
MELIYVIPADAAEANPNGKFSLLGGGIDNISVPAFPAVHPGIALVVRLRAQTSEAKQSHSFHINIDGPNNFQTTPGAIAEFTPIALQSEPDRPIVLNLVMNIALLVFPEPGTYLFHLYVDNQEVGMFPLYVQLLNPNEVGSA